MAWQFRLSLALILSNVLVCIGVFWIFLSSTDMTASEVRSLLCVEVVTWTHALAAGVAVISPMGARVKNANRSYGAIRYAFAALPAGVIFLLGIKSSSKSPHACIPDPWTAGIFFAIAVLILVLGLWTRNTQDRH